MPRITVAFFGPARDLAGTSSISIDVAKGETVGGLAARLSDEHPRLGAALGIRLAVNRAYVPLNRVLADGDEIAVIPPVSGGAPRQHVRLTREPIDVDAVVREIQTQDAGAVVTFTGVVRAETRDGRALAALAYHAYEEMAREQMQAVRRRAIETFDLSDAVVVHRLGTLDLGAASVVIVAVSAHREAAFDACRWIIDAVKTDVPIWKKDIWADGTQTWVDSTQS